jgi:hypothetical protein
MLSNATQTREVRTMTISEQLRERVRLDGRTVHAVAVDARVPAPTLAAFVRGGGLNTRTVDRLAAYFGLELKPATSSGTKGGAA